MEKTALEKLNDLYDREINFSMSTFWDGGYDVKIGDAMNGFKAEATAENAEQAIEWIYEKANELYSQ